MVRINQTSVGEEIFNAISHGVGALAGVVGLIFLMIRAHDHWQANRFWGLLVFGITLIFMYLMSTLYHSLIFTKAKKVFKILDYSAIALFIAGSYTPIALVGLKGNLGWILLIGVWALTITGILWRIFGRHKDKVSLGLYLLTGWLIMFFIKPLAQNLPHLALVMLIAGGVAYTVGTVFFQWKKLVFNHGIWHLLVLTGSICHFVVMMKV
jgi:hemolysin III